MVAQENVSFLADEYRALLVGIDLGDREALVEAMIAELNWTPQAAEQLVRLANDYGSFMLRNALAFSLAIGVEDGKLGF
jgi:hypothetical protein